MPNKHFNLDDGDKTEGRTSGCGRALMTIALLHVILIVIALLSMAFPITRRLLADWLGM